MSKELVEVEKEVNGLIGKLDDLKKEIGKVIGGQEETVEQLTI